METPRWHDEAAEVSAGKERQSLDLPMPSREERDRRWALLRERMFFRGLECLIITGSGSSSGLANVRYVTGLGPAVGALAVFPFIGEPVGFYGNAHEHVPFGGWSLVPGQWLDDVRPNRGVRAIVDAVREAGLGRGRIGVVATRPIASPVSTVAASFLDGLRKGLPDALISDETAMVDELRLIKSDEELVFLRRAGEIARHRIERLVVEARPGVTEAEVFAAMAHEAIIRGGEQEPFNLFSVGSVSPRDGNGRVQALLHGSYPPYGASLRPLEEGDMVICEFHTNYGGYQAATEFSVFLGEAPEQLRHVHDVATEVIRMAGDLFVPGRLLSDVYNSFHRHVEKAGLDFVELGFHGHGLSGLEFPAAVYREADLASVGRAGMGQMRLRENMVLGINVDIHDPDWRRDVGVMLGDMVAVNEGGAEYLCNTPLDLFELEAGAAVA